jgi:hypothetical protein
LTVPRRVNAEHRTASVRDVFDWNEVDARRVSTVNREVVDLPGVGSAGISRIAVVPVAAARREDHCPESEAASLALDSSEAFAIVDHEVVARVLTKRLRNDETQVA